jgi:phosphoribosylformylglycinamidine synthase
VSIGVIIVPEICWFRPEQRVSDFRVKRLHDHIAQTVAHDRFTLEITPLIVSVCSFKECDVTQQRLLATLSKVLGAQYLSQGIGAFDGNVFIIPRRGTISPWSSKAQDILKQCSINEVRRLEAGRAIRLQGLKPEERGIALLALHDRMVEGVYLMLDDYFEDVQPTPLRFVDILVGGKPALEKANVEFGLALNEPELQYLYDGYRRIGRNPSDAELVMFGQVNSEHCRHKIFNADFVFLDANGNKVIRDRSLFKMIKNTYEANPGDVLLAYSDNSSCIVGHQVDYLDRIDGVYQFIDRQVDIIMKVETHNHPTAIAPFAGAATGVGGEIRDEGSTGRGSRSKAGLAAFVVSHLRLPDLNEPWELKPRIFSRLATPLKIMIDGPIGGAAFGNEFGRPQLCGVFRTFEIDHGQTAFGYHKPIMVAGGVGSIWRENIGKRLLSVGSLVIQLGGPSLRIGVGGGAASSLATGTNTEDLDFSSVQRSNPEMQRRCQEVIDACCALGAEANPILAIHDVGAGGLSNACPELVEKVGAVFDLRSIPCDDASLSPMEIWCNESQERYVLAIESSQLGLFSSICERERCPFAVIGRVTEDMRLSVSDSLSEHDPVDVPLEVLLGKPPKLTVVAKEVTSYEEGSLPEIDLLEAAGRVIRHPTVARKDFLITITDRTVTGLVSRDQMVGPYQVPVSDVAVTLAGYSTFRGEAFAMGERMPLSILNAKAAARVAVGEALTNIFAAPVQKIGDIKLSANWMAACGEEGENARLWQAVEAVGMELCPHLGIAIPVGKDSLSMKSIWSNGDTGVTERVISPVSLMVSAFAPVNDVRGVLTPYFDIDSEQDLEFLLLDMSAGERRMGGSIYAQTCGVMGEPHCPDIDDVVHFANCLNAIIALHQSDSIVAYHDISDGGLYVTISEFCIASRCGAEISLDFINQPSLRVLFAEELGVCLVVERSKRSIVLDIVKQFNIEANAHFIGKPVSSQHVRYIKADKIVLEESLGELVAGWSKVSHSIQRLRDNPDCAEEELKYWCDLERKESIIKLTFNPEEQVSTFNVVMTKPRVAILREQGVNGHVEMAASFMMAGFEAHDIHMSDIQNDRADLSDFKGIVACGGFSYGDVLGAGSGWANAILFSQSTREKFVKFFNRSDTFALGVCNGCQMMSQLKSIIPGAMHWPVFMRNKSEQFEARLVHVLIDESPSIFFAGMQGSILPIPVAHGEGLPSGDLQKLVDDKLVVARFVDGMGNCTEAYPYNPNGAFGGITGVTTVDGRFTILMPHPERAVRAVQLSYSPKGIFKKAGPYLQMFINARKWV